MSTKITQDEINKVVWNACDTFRGVVDPSQYKDYILTMLFLKYVSDVNKSKYAEYLERYEGDEERAQRAMRRERFQVPETSSFYYLYDNRNAVNIGELIDIALVDLENANREKLNSEDGSGIFRNISFNSSNLGEVKDRNVRLKQLLEDFADEKLQFDESHLDNNDVIGDAYMFLIEHFASDAGKKAGEFFTPKEVSTLLAKLTKSAPGSNFMKKRILVLAVLLCVSIVMMACKKTGYADRDEVDTIETLKEKDEQEKEKGKTKEKANNRVDKAEGEE